MNSCFRGEYTIAVHRAEGVFSKSTQNKMINYMHRNPQQALPMRTGTVPALGLPAYSESVNAASRLRLRETVPLQA